MKNLYTVLFLFLIAFLIFPAYSPAQEHKPLDVTSVTPAQNPSVASNFTWKENNEETDFYTVSEGKITLFNFWGAWCGPCVNELPDLSELEKEMPDDKYLFIGMDIEKYPNIVRVEGLMIQNDIQYRVFYNIFNQGIANDIYNAYGSPGGFPTTYIFGPDHRLLSTLVGSRSKEVFRAELEKYLGIDYNKNNKFSAAVWPNPVEQTPNTVIKICPEVNARFLIELYDQRGNRVRLIHDDYLTKGEHMLSLELGGLASGMYFCRITGDGETSVIMVNYLR